MLIDRILYPITALGPGKRLCIWTVGCNKRCYMCANPELWFFDKSKEVSMEEIKKLLSLVDFEKLDGFTVSGGEPFCQARELFELLNFFSEKSEDILVFSGYTYEELKNMENPYVKLCLEYIGVLVAGEYQDALNDNKTALVASGNQRLYVFQSDLKERYEKYQRQGRQIQNIFYKNELMSVGIHNRGGIA